MKLTGIGVGTGVALGPVVRMPEPQPEPEDTPSVRSPDDEHARAVTSLRAVAASIRERGTRAGGSAVEILEAQALMAEDPALIEDIRMRLGAGITAERAVFEGFDHFRAQLTSLGGYLAERANDLDDVARRTIAHLRGVEAPAVPDPDHPFVLVARDLAPADTAVLDLDKVLALVMIEGGPTSHTAILARATSIVAVVGVASAADLADGDEVIVDAAAGAVISAPSPAQRSEAEAAIARRAVRVHEPIGPGALADGTPVTLLANIGSLEDAPVAAASGAEGVGLLRTEFLYLGAAQAPSVAAQREQYTALLRPFGARKVVARVLDAGADKPLAYLSATREQNPALGVRGLRVLQANERVLRDQLAALSAAGADSDADLWVMAPMVATVEETRYFTALAREHGLRTAGVMIEVPSAALIAERILAECDFVSIGTNDLTQYTLAADRLLGSLGALQNPWHPAVLSLIDRVARAGALHGKPVGVCGEAAADPLLAVVLAGLGVTSLSMSVGALADVGAELARHSLDRAREFAALALSADSAVQAQAAVVTAAS